MNLPHSGADVNLTPRQDVYMVKEKVTFTCKDDTQYFANGQHSIEIPCTGPNTWETMEVPSCETIPGKIYLHFRLRLIFVMIIIPTFQEEKEMVF